MFLCFQLHILHLRLNVTTDSWITLHSKRINQSSSKRHSDVTNVKNPYLDVVRAVEIPLAQSRRLLALDLNQWNMAKGALTTAATRYARALRGYIHRASSLVLGLARMHWGGNGGPGLVRKRQGGDRGVAWTVGGGLARMVSHGRVGREVASSSRVSLSLVRSP